MSRVSKQRKRMAKVMDDAKEKRILKCKNANKKFKMDDHTDKILNKPYESVKKRKNK